MSVYALRLIALVALMVAANVVGVLVSDAPLRLQLLRALAWNPAVLPAALIVWSRDLPIATRVVGFLGTAMAAALAAVLVAASNTKLELDALSYLVSLAGWLLYAILLIALSTWTARGLGRS